MASVSKREWTYKGEKKEAWVVRYTDQSGKRRLKTYERKKEADAERLRIETEIEKGIHVAGSETMAVKDAAPKFLLACQKRKIIGEVSGGWLKQIDYQIGFLIARLGARRVSELQSDDFKKLYDDMLIEKYAAATVHNIHAGSFAFLQFCVKHRLVRRNVLADEPVKLPKQRRRAKIPSRTDLVTLIKGLGARAPAEQLQPYVNRCLAVKLGICCGLRPGEIFGLQWSDIDWQRRLIHVQHSQSLIDGLKSPKSEAGFRDVPLPEVVVEAFLLAARYYDVRKIAESRATRSEQPKALLARTSRYFETMVIETRLDDSRTGYVMKTKYGRPYTSETSSMFWRPMMKRLGLWIKETDEPKFTMHALRHAAASLFIAARLPPMNLKTVIGHASVSTTYDVYGHLFPEDTRTVDTVHDVAKELSIAVAQPVVIDATRMRHSLPNH